MDPIFTQQFNYPTPQMPSQGGMFGGDSKWRNALLAAVAGFMARRSPGVAGNIINGLQDAQTLKQRMAFAQQEHQQQVRDQIDVYDAHRQYDIANPLPQQPGEFEQALVASGVHPGTPEWAQAMKTKVQNTLDPVVMTPQGLMVRSQVLGAGGGQPAPPGITFTPLPDQGGPASQAPGGFPY